MLVAAAARSAVAANDADAVLAIQSCGQLRLRLVRGRDDSAVTRIEEAMEPVGEPGCDPARRHALVDLGRGEQLARRLAAGKCAAQFSRNFGPRL